MAICFVLIKVAPGSERNVYNKLSKILEVVESHIVSGDYDVIVKLKVNDLKSLPILVSSKIRPIEGVKDTRTLTGLELK